ncbi:MAG: hypothetical protein HUJ68_13075 [Clostridia bacterium]|nr:hypothetical protein [Clostridia bacterium]
MEKFKLDFIDGYTREGKVSRQMGTFSNKEKAIEWWGLKEDLSIKAYVLSKYNEETSEYEEVSCLNKSMIEALI